MKLGQDYDYVPAIFPQDNDGGIEGFRVHMSNYGGMSIVGFFGSTFGSAQLVVREHDAPSGGTSQDLQVVTRYYFKGGPSTILPQEPWEERNQEASATFGDIEWGGAGVKVFFETSVQSEDLSDGFEWLSADTNDGLGTTTAAVFYSLYDLTIQRQPPKLPITVA